MYALFLFFPKEILSLPIFSQFRTMVTTYVQNTCCMFLSVIDLSINSIQLFMALSKMSFFVQSIKS